MDLKLGSLVHSGSIQQRHLSHLLNIKPKPFFTALNCTNTILADDIVREQQSLQADTSEFPGCLRSGGHTFSQVCPSPRKNPSQNQPNKKKTPAKIHPSASEGAKKSLPRALLHFFIRRKEIPGPRHYTWQRFLKGLPQGVHFWSILAP